MISKVKAEAAEQLKQLEAASNKVWKEVEKAKKEGKGQANALIKGFKQGQLEVEGFAIPIPRFIRVSCSELTLLVAAPEDIDDLVKQLKDAANKAGLPADQIESWLRAKAGEKNIDPEQLVSAQVALIPRHFFPGIGITAMDSFR